MIEDITPILDRVNRTIKGLLTQFRGQPNLEAIAASYGAQFQEIEDMLIEIYVLTALENAVGVQLDEIGKLVDEDRGDKNDDNYRAAIYGRITLNKANSTIEDILFAMDSMYNTTYELKEQGDATMRVIIQVAQPGTIDPETMNETLQRARGAGVEATYEFSDYAPDYRFKWAPGSSRVIAANTGWSNTAKTTGGKRTNIAG